MTDTMKPPHDVLRWPNGEPMIVVRPENPRLVVALAQIAVNHDSMEALRQTSEGDHVFLGFLVRRDGMPFAVDSEGENAIAVEPGDLFVEPDSLVAPS